MAKGEWATFSSSISKLGNDNLAAARIEAQEKAKDCLAAEAACTLYNIQRERKTGFFS